MLLHQYNYYQKLGNKEKGKPQPKVQYSQPYRQLNKKTIPQVTLLNTAAIFIGCISNTLRELKSFVSFIFSFLIGLFTRQSNSRKALVLTISLFFCVLLAAWFLLGDHAKNEKRLHKSYVELDLPAPLLSETEVVQTDDVHQHVPQKVSAPRSFNPLAALKSKSQKQFQPKWLEFTVKKGDSLSSLFSQAKLSSEDLVELLGSRAGGALENIVAGKQIAFLKDQRGNLQALKYVKDSMETLLIERNSDQQFRISRQVKSPESLLDYAEGEIDMSLFNDGRKAGLSDNLIMSLADIFAWDIDFTQDIRPGDSFSVLYKKQVIDGVPTGKGQILAATFVIQGEEKTAIYYSNSQGESSYFTKDGQNLRKRFLRMPLDFGRISSGFNLARKHPVLNTIRAHKGTDYAASTGTPIKATGSGRIAFAGWSNGYGNNVIIDHGNGYTTLYGHMQKLNVAKGQRIKQSQVIGTVGTSGLATGPHVHYEFRVNGTYKDPVKVKLPGALALTGKEKNLFDEHKKQLFKQRYAMQMVVAQAGK